MNIKLQRALCAAQTDQIAIVGSGGKTTALFQLARQFSSPVIVTTSTHLGGWELTAADQHFTVRSVEDVEKLDKAVQKNGVTVISGWIDENNRTMGLSPGVLLAMHRLAESMQIPLLIEADGSRQKPLKAPAQHEPAIPDWVKSVLVVSGLSGLGKALNEQTVQRADVFGALTGLQPGEEITSQVLLRYLLHPVGGLKNIPPDSQKFVLLNQADTDDLRQQADAMAAELLSQYHGVITASLNHPEHDEKVYAVHKRIAGIILAAGASSRFGQAKVLLEWKGKPLVWHAIQTAMQAGLAPIVVVAGDHFEAISAALADLPVHVVMNKEWAEGQSSSVQAGINALDPQIGAAVFLLADMPLVPVKLINGLRSLYSHTLSPIVVPVVDGHRTSPTLFDKSTFADLRSLRGDVGGRALFQRYSIAEFNFFDSAAFMDVDTDEDFRKLQEIS